MSPEQATGSSEIDARSDVYSLGCVTFEMLSGETPHSGSTAAAIMTNKVSGSPPSVTALRPMTPEGVDRAIQKALQSAPADRFSTAADFASALGGAIQGPQDAAPRSSRRRSRLRKIGIPAGLVAGAVLAAALLWRTTSQASGRRAIDAFQEAIAEDPNWAPAHAALGTVHHWRNEFEESERSLRKALELDGSYGPAWASLGYVLYAHERNFPEARAALEQAAALGTPSWGTLGLLLTEWGQFEDALQAQEQARRLSPLSGALLGNRAWSYVCAGDFERAVVELEALVDGEYDRPWTRAWLVQAYLKSGDRQSASVALDRLEDLGNPGDLVAGHLASLYALVDRRPEAEALLEEAERDGDPITLFHAAAAVSMGERERALGYLERARELEQRGIMYGRCTEVAELAGEPGYEEFLDRIGVPEEGRR